MKNILKFKKADTDFSPYQRDWKESEQINILFVSHISEEVKIAYKSNYIKRKNRK